MAVTLGSIAAALLGFSNTKGQVLPAVCNLLLLCCNNLGQQQ
jgi:hypothetical protein